MPWHRVPSLYTSHHLDESNLDQLVHIHVQVPYPAPRVFAQPEERRKGDASRPSLRPAVLADAELFLADDVHDLVLVGGLEPVEVLAREVLRGRRRGGDGEGGWVR